MTQNSPAPYLPASPVSSTSDILEPSPDLAPALAASSSYSPDMAPVSRLGRKWGIWDIAALWISMSACVTTYTLASDLITGGMNWYQAVLTIFLANTIVLIPMVLNAHAGTRYGIPFPVYCRSSFGLRGANIPALLRAFVACGWFGIQTWIGGEAIYTIFVLLVPSAAHSPDLFVILAATGKDPARYLNLAQAACFLLFWLINMAVIYAGINSIRLLLNIKAPLLILMGLALLAWAVKNAGGWGPMLTQPSAFEPGQPQAGQFWSFFFPALTGAVGYWATLSLNIPDFSRYAKSQKSQVLGQAIGLPTTMALYSFIGVAVTSATVVIYGKAIWNPVELTGKFTNPFVLVLALFCLTLATLATNIAANVVSPANDFAHLAPRKISFRTGGLITGILGILMQPWKLYNDPTGYIFTWLIAYGALLGAVGGILIADYYWIRKTKLDFADLYLPSGRYWYKSGFNPIAILALLLGIAPCAPGFLATVHLITLAPGSLWVQLYHYAWFLSFFISFFTYALLTLLTKPRTTPIEPR